MLDFDWKIVKIFAIIYHFICFLITYLVELVRIERGLIMSTLKIENLHVSIGEKEILKGVEQYMWLHRRFKTRPTEDEPSLYS